MKCPFSSQLLASAGAALLLAGAGVQSARASFLVTTVAVAGTSGGASGLAAYNDPNFPCGFGSCFIITGAATATGTVEHTGTLTAASDQAALNSGNDSAAASADLSSGALKVSTSSPSTTLSQGANASASFTDTLHLLINGAGPATVTNIGFRLSLDGVMTSVANPGVGESLTWTANVNGSVLGISLFDGNASLGIPGCTVANVPCIESQNVGTWNSPSFSADNAANVVFNGTIAVLGATPSISISDSVGITGATGAPPTLATRL